ncbi:MAG: hypothetical protein FJ359_05740 [Thaumarchaeota archaeon]|nr:hypothetical protein [Nitrososphaerota archaeon]
MKYVAALLVVFAFVITLAGSAYAHKAEVIGDYKIEVGWKDEPPIIGQKNAIEIIVTVATEHDKESQEPEEHEEHMEHEEAKHDEHLEAGTGVSGLSKKLEATVSLKGQKTTLVLVETSKLGVYQADYTPSEVGFPSVNVVGQIGDEEEFEITFHPEKVEPVSILSPLQQLRLVGDPAKVMCREDLELFVRAGSSVVCLSPTTAQALLSRGWELTQLEMIEDEATHETRSEGMLYVFADGKIAIIDPHSGEIVKELTDGLENVSWADPILTPDGKHVLVNDRDNAQVIVIDTHEQEIIKRIDVGPRPVHIYNPNHGNEIWTHSDTEGAFYVIDAKTLEVTDVVVAAKNETLGGHGKLIYSEALGSKSAATNTKDNGIHLIDRDSKKAYGFVETCVNGGTHGKAFSAASNHMYIECGGDRKTVVVDAETDTVVTTIDGSGQIFEIPEKDLIVIVAKKNNQLIVVDATTDEVVATIPVEGGPDKLLFYKNNEKIYGFTANTLSPDTAVIDFDTMQVVKTIPAGDIARPEGALFYHRGGDIGDKFFFTPADGDNLVSIIDAENLELHMQIPLEGPHGLIFVSSHH